MKIKHLLLAVFAGGLIYSCKKDETIDKKKKNDPVEVIPDTFVKRVLIEKFTGEWCGACPGGATRLENVINDNPDKVIGVGVHRSDPFQTNQTLYLRTSSMYAVSSYPSGVVDRIKESSYSTSAMASKVSNMLTETPKCGIKINTSESGGLLDVSVSVVANEDLPNAHLTVYLVENNVAESSPGAQSGASTGYIHQHVLRATLSNQQGDDLGITETRKKYTLEYSGIDISSYKKTDLKVVAFVNENSSSSANFKSYNAKEIKVGESTDWD